jgi:xylulokinase
MATEETGFIGIDAGTSGCKTIVLSEQGQVLATASSVYRTQRGPQGEVTQDANDWVQAMGSTVQACVRAVPGLTIGAIGVTAPAHNAVLVGEDGEPLHRVILWSDARTGGIASELREHYGPEFFAKTFVDLSPSWTLPQLVWLRRQFPEVWGRIRYVLIGKDYLRYRLTGMVGTDPSDAAGTAMFDQRGRAWLEPLCRDAGLMLEQLPPIRCPTELAGGLSSQGARLLGLPIGTPVSVGATDTAAELTSVGADDPGSALVKIASSGVVVAVSDMPHPDRRVLTYPHPITGHWYTVAATSTAATAYRWLRDTLFMPNGQPGGSTYAHMDALASGVPAGAGGVLFLPFLEGERSPYWDRDLRAAFLGVSSAHGPANLCRAVMEGVALSLRACSDLLAGIGLPTHNPYLGGGGVGSRLWRQILVSALGEPGYVATPQGPGVGAAMLAAAAVGQTAPTNRPVGGSPSRETVAPEPHWRDTYERLYATYGAAADAVSAISHNLVRQG